MLFSIIKIEFRFKRRLNQGLFNISPFINCCINSNCLMKKLSKISLDKKMRKLDQLSNSQMGDSRGGYNGSIHFSLPPVTTPPPYNFSIKPPGGSIKYTF